LADILETKLNKLFLILEVEGAKTRILDNFIAREFN
jgi:hypothetical protein